MKKYISNIQTLLIIVLIIIIIFLRNCSSKPTSPTEGSVVVRVETRWDTVRKTVPIYTPVYKDRIVTLFDTLYKDVDTSFILEDYFASYIYLDTFQNDSISIIINDTISQNKIKNRSLKYELLYPVTTMYRDSIVRKRGYYVGAGFGSTTDQLNYIGGEFLYTSKKKTAFGIGLGVNQNFQFAFTGRFYWKLGKN